MTSSGGCTLRSLALACYAVALLLLPASCSDLHTLGLVDQLSLHPEEQCMSKQQLRDVVSVAAWRAEGGRSAVLLTNCNLACLKELFEPFIWSIQNNSRDGDFSQHLIIVGNGIAAYLYCDGLRQRYRHHCVLDRNCAPPASGLGHVSAEVTLGKPLYFLALMQKVAWAAEVVKLGTSVVWTDMDLTYFGNPLPFLINAAADADMIVQSEYWDAANVFQGDVCRFEGPHAGCTAKEKSPKDRIMHKPGVCCGMATNGGLWLVNPTPRGQLLLQAWAALLFKEGVVQRKLGNGSATIDQEMLYSMLMARGGDPRDPAYMAYHSVPLYSWDRVRHQYVNYANVTRAGNEVVYRISMQRAQSRCYGECGYMSGNEGFRQYMQGQKMVCVMPQSSADRVIALHQNCLSSIKAKRDNMLQWKNWAVDEAAYLKEAAEAHRTVFPPEGPAGSGVAACLPGLRLLCAGVLAACLAVVLL